MWQPFNGLQIFISGTGTSPVDPSLFAQIPPPLCKKEGGATFRIKCDDNGLPTGGNTSSSAAAAVTAAVDDGAGGSGVTVATTDGVSKMTTTDEYRAHTAVPRHGFRGDSFASMSTTLNGWLKHRLPSTTFTIATTVEPHPSNQGSVNLLYFNFQLLRNLYAETAGKPRPRVGQ